MLSIQLYFVRPRKDHTDCEGRENPSSVQAVRSFSVSISIRLFVLRLHYAAAEQKRLCLKTYWPLCAPRMSSTGGEDHQHSPMDGGEPATLGRGVPAGVGIGRGPLPGAVFPHFFTKDRRLTDNRDVLYQASMRRRLVSVSVPHCPARVVCLQILGRSGSGVMPRVPDDPLADCNGLL